MTLNKGLLTSKSNEWATPVEFFNELDREFGFTLDPCATPENAKCQLFYTKEEDGLTLRWNGVVFMNPPYGREIGKWMEKAFKESRGGGRLLSALCRPGLIRAGGMTTQ